MIANKKKKLFIEANSLLDKNPSGISKLLFSMILSMSTNADFDKDFKIILFIPLNKKNLLKRWKLPSTVSTRTLPLPLRIINGLNKRHLMFPVDLWLGSGVYLFPNYRTLPLIRSKCMTYIHDVAYAKHPETLLEINRKFLEHTIPQSVKTSDMILTLSEQSKIELLDLFPQFSSKIKVVPAGVDESHYVISDSNEGYKKLLNDVGVEDNKYILFVGNIEPRKNIAYLIDVYVELIDRGTVKDNVALLLVGGGGWNNEELILRIKTLVASGYKIVRPSSRISDEDLPTLYKHSILTTLLSIHEGFGMTPLEALASGSKVVVSDIPVLHEVCGKSVLYAPLKDKEQAADVFETALNQPRNTSYSREILDEYSWDNAAETFRKNLINVENTKVEGVL